MPPSEKLEPEPANSRPKRVAHYLILALIVVAVVVVSLPRLSEFGLHENENDAHALMVRLWPKLAQHMQPSSLGSKLEDTTIEALMQHSSGMLHWATDSEFLEHGTLLRRHGYLAELTVAPDGRPALRAWPWTAGKTGIQVFVGIAGGALAVHPNSKLEWSGPKSPPPFDALDAEHGWSPIEGEE